MIIISFEEDNFKDDNLFEERVHLMQKAGIRAQSESQLSDDASTISLAGTNMVFCRYQLLPTPTETDRFQHLDN